MRGTPDTEFDLLATRECWVGDYRLFPETVVPRSAARKWYRIPYLRDVSWMSPRHPVVLHNLPHTREIVQSHIAIAIGIINDIRLPK
jgi:hypothetical protein